MQPLEVRKYLFDISQACALIAQFVTGRTLADYLADPMLRSAVERQLGIIGEAVNQVVRLDPALEASLSDTRRIISFRNRLIHTYFAISDEVVWGIVEVSLHVLCPEVEAILTPGP